MRGAWVVMIAWGCSQEPVARIEAEVEPADQGVEVRAQALVVGTDCPAHVVDVQPGVDVRVDWSAVTMDALGEPLHDDVSEASVMGVTYVDILPDEVIALCGEVPSEQKGAPIFFRTPDEGDVAERTVLASELPGDGGILGIQVVSHGQLAVVAFLLPDSASTTTELVVQ